MRQDKLEDISSCRYFKEVTKMGSKEGNLREEGNVNFFWKKFFEIRNMPQIIPKFQEAKTPSHSPNPQINLINQHRLPYYPLGVINSEQPRIVRWFWTTYITPQYNPFKNRNVLSLENIALI